MKKVLFIQARLSSSRLPAKMLQKIHDMTLLEYVYKRCQQISTIDDIYIITSVEQSDDKLVAICKNSNMNYFRGDLDNVLQRFIDAAHYLKLSETDLICRVCGDSPFVDIHAIEQMIKHLEESHEEYIRVEGTLNGFKSEVFHFRLLKNLLSYPLTSSHYEHVTSYILENKSNFNINIIDLDLFPHQHKELSLTVDYPKDLNTVNYIANKLDGFNFQSKDILNILNRTKGSL